MRRFGFVQAPHATLAMLAFTTCIVSAQGAQAPAAAGASGPGTRHSGRATADVVFHHQHADRQGRKPWRAGRRRRALPDPGGCRRRRQPRVAGLSQHPGPRGRECAGPHRQGAMGQRQRAVGCARPGAPARRHPRPRAHGQHVDARDGAQRKGEQVPGPPFPGAPAPVPANVHDILTGSQLDGRAYTDGADHTCNNWTSEDAGSAQVGHHDRTGGPGISWNSVHASKGCSQQGLISTGGAGLLYCFATGETK